MEEKILILAKTYPSPSAQYVETSCIAGINQDGIMRRLYPVPFRMIEDSKKFKKWQWVQARIKKSSTDHRAESHRLYVDTIICLDEIDTKNEWASRREWINRIPAFDTLHHNSKDGFSLTLLRPKELIGLEIIESRHPDWTEEEKAKLTRLQMQGNLFQEDVASKQIIELRKVPFDFYYRHLCDTPEGQREYKHKIVDWEAGALFWTCLKKYGEKWETPFREKLYKQFKNKDLMFLMGNLHRFQNQWLIISLIYPPRQRPSDDRQASLF